MIALGVGVVAACRADVGPRAESTGARPPQAAVELRTPSITIGVGESFERERGREVPGGVAWRSVAPGVVDVSETGLITALAPGRADVIARSVASADTADVRVHAVLARIEIPEDTVELAIERNAQLEFRAFGAGGRSADPLALHDLAWGSSRPEIASVDAAGRVVAVSIGATDVTVSAGTVADTVTIQVVDAPVALLAIDPVRTPLAAGSVDTIRATAWDAHGRHLARRIINWTSSDPTVAALTPVAAGGLLSALRPGTTTVTARSEGRSDAIAIQVGAPDAASAELPRVFLRTRVEDTPSRGRTLHVGAEPTIAGTAASQASRPVGPLSRPPHQ